MTLKNLYVKFVQFAGALCVFGNRLPTVERSANFVAWGGCCCRIQNKQKNGMLGKYLSLLQYTCYFQLCPSMPSPFQTFQNKPGL